MIKFCKCFGYLYYTSRKSCFCNARRHRPVKSGVRGPVSEVIVIALQLGLRVWIVINHIANFQFFHIP